MATDKGWRWPNKGDHQQAEEGARNLIRLAFQVRNDMIKLKKREQGPTAVANATAAAPIIINVSTTNPLIAADLSSPSSFLNKHDWVLKIYWTFMSSANCVTSMDQEFKDNADALLSLCRERLVAHIKKRVEDTSKHNHWCFTWTFLNLPRLIAMAALFGHIRPDVMYVAADGCLLHTDRSRYLIIDTEHEEKEGVYLYYNANDSRVIRSGKVVGSTRNFKIRDKEHRDSAMLGTKALLASCFYTSFPSKKSMIDTSKFRRGYREDLLLFVGAAFDRKDASQVSNLCDTNTDTGLLNWPQDTISHINKVNFPGCFTLQDKQLHMVGYVIELFYDLLISTSDNVSSSPGFETCIGVFGKKQ